jgi:hypothetical protein
MGVHGPLNISQVGSGGRICPFLGFVFPTGFMRLITVLYLSYFIKAGEGNLMDTTDVK